MARMHIKHHRKGHISPRFEHQEVLERDEAVLVSVTRTRPIPQPRPTRPANGHYEILDDEQALRRAYAAERDILPWPTKPERGLYSRVLMQQDLDAIAAYEHTIIEAIAKGSFEGHSIRAFNVCERMRANCKAALMRTVSILQAKEAEEKLKQATNPIVVRGIRLTPAQSEHIRRLATDKDYLLREVKRNEETSKRP